MTTNKAIAFLDILGFKNFVQDDSLGALGILTAAQSIFQTKRDDDLYQPVEIYADILKEIASKNSLDSVTDFMPFSDSIILISDSPNEFLKQLSTYILDTFIYSSQIFMDELDKKNPKMSLGIDSKGMPTGIKEFPNLFRGGASYGEAILLKLSGKIDKKPTDFFSVCGNAVINAVELEKSLKGPRLAIDDFLFNELNDETKFYIKQTYQESTNTHKYEVLWPAFKYNLRNNDNPENEIFSFYELFIPAVNLWKLYMDNESVKVHYFNFIKLIIEGTVCAFDYYKLKDYACNYIKEQINEEELEENEKSSLLSLLT